MILLDIDNNISTVLFFGTVGMLIIALIVMVVIHFAEVATKRQEVKAKIISLKNHFKEEILNAQVDIQEKTMRNISLEIHDNIGQLLTLAKLNLSTIDNYQDELQENKISDARNLIGQSIADLRSLSKVLGTDLVQNGGLIRGIELLLDTIERSGIIKTHFQCSKSSYNINVEHQLILFRIVQESLNNVIKHSRATEVSVDISENTGLISLRIKDNGIGIPSDYNTHGCGLSHMKRRAKMIGAELHISAMPHDGTSVTIRIQNFNELHEV